LEAWTPEAEQQVRALGVTKFVEKAFSLHLLGDALKRLLDNVVTDDLATGSRLLQLPTITQFPHLAV
jgi:hypothetical protein